MQRDQIVAIVLTGLTLAWLLVNTGLLFNGSNSCVVIGGFAAAFWLCAVSLYVAADALLYGSFAKRTDETTSSSKDLRGSILCCCCSTVTCCTEKIVVYFPAGYYAFFAILQLASTISFAIAWRWNALICSIALTALLVFAFLVHLSKARKVYPDSSQADSTAPAKEHDAEMAEVSATDENNPTAATATTDDIAPASGATKCCSTFRTTLSVVAGFVMVGLFAGSVQEASGYLQYPANGTWITITHNRTPAGCTITQHILTQCAEPENYNSSLPTFWSEVGGGGHSMSDLWGLRDELVNTHGRRYCSYDMPGTGWSSPIVNGAGDLSGTRDFEYITDLVMDALGETGRYVLMGSMDGAYNRAAKFAIDRPEHAVAVVPVTIFNDEFLLYRDFNNITTDEMIEYGVSQLSGRYGFGNLIMLFGTSFGLISVFTPASSSYQPQDKAQESIFLNLQTEKQWATNCDYIRHQMTRPIDKWIAEPYIVTKASELGANGIPVLDFFLERNSSQLAQQCLNSRWELDSSECAFANWTYAQNVALNEELTRRVNDAAGDNSSSIIMCGAECADTTNAFLLNQDDHIAWFARTMIQALDDLQL